MPFHIETRDKCVLSAIPTSNVHLVQVHECFGVDRVTHSQKDVLDEDKWHLLACERVGAFVWVVITNISSN